MNVVKLKTIQIISQNKYLKKLKFHHIEPDN